jgi:hypothetical protein
MIPCVTLRGALLSTAAAAALAFASSAASANSITFGGIVFSMIDLSGGELQVTFSPETGTSIKASVAGGTWDGVNYLESFDLKPAGTYTGASLSDWTEVNGGLNNGPSGTGCNDKGDTGAFCFYHTGGPLSIPATGDMVFDVFFTGSTPDFTTVHLKVRFLDDRS